MSDLVFDIASTTPRRGVGERAARPRAAATLIVVRRDGPEARVLMGRRHAGARFMPDRWVFPGGVCEPGDARAAAATELTEEAADLLARAVAPGRASRLPRALAMAAVRETWEETGLRLARPAPGASPAAADPWRAFAADGRLPDLAALRLVARVVTPPALPRRFDARFFEADAEAFAGLDARASPELDRVAWLTPDEARGLELPSVTRFVLRELERRLAGEARPPLFLRISHGRRRADALHDLPRG